MGDLGPRRVIIPEVERNTTGNAAVTEAINVIISEVNNTEDSVYTNPGDVRFFGLSVGLFVILVGTIGNGLTVWAYGRNRNLQTSFNVLIANLCCVELLFSLVIIPLQMPGYIIQRSAYPEGLCATIGYFYYCSMAASLQNLVAIAVNRYVGIVGTKRYQKLFTGARLRICVISIWLLPPILYLPVVAGGLISWKQPSLRCAIGIDNGHYAIRIYNTTLNVLYQAGSLILLCALYTSIMKKVNEVQKKLKMHKKASFKSTTRKSKKKNKDKETVKNGMLSTPATTSGDEAIEDYRPSSLVSGGFHFRPAKDGKNQESYTDSAHGSDHEFTSKRISEHATESQASFGTISDEPSPRPQKRMSLWRSLFKKSEETLDKNQNQKTSDDNTNDISGMSSTPDPDTPDADIEKEPEEPEVILRNMDQDKKDMRRKKSLSAPTLPSLDEITQSRKSSAAVVQNIPEQVKEVHEMDSAESSPRLYRAFTVGSKFHRKIQPTIKISHIHGDSPLASATNLSNRLGETGEKPFCNSMPSLNPAVHSEPTIYTRFGTIARKIRDHKRSKRRTRSERTRQRERAMRKRHARERQLVYSSFAICIAFALCILPTSVTHLTQVIFDVKVEASVILIVGCISWLHAITNPFIYGYMNHLYRSEYDRIARELEKKIAACFK